MFYYTRQSICTSGLPSGSAKTASLRSTRSICHPVPERRQERAQIFKVIWLLLFMVQIFLTMLTSYQNGNVFQNYDYQTTRLVRTFLIKSARSQVVQSATLDVVTGSY